MELINTKMKTLLLSLLLLGVAINAQIKKDDLAHIEAGALIHSGTYILVDVLQDGKGNLWKPFVVVNVVGTTWELSRMNRPNGRFDWNDMALNNLGALISLGLIEGGQAIGIPKKYSMFFVASSSLIGLGITAQF